MIKVGCQPFVCSFAANLEEIHQKIPIRVHFAGTRQISDNVIGVDQVKKHATPAEWHHI